MKFECGIFCFAHIFLTISPNQLTVLNKQTRSNYYTTRPRKLLSRPPGNASCNVKMTYVDGPGRFRVNMYAVGSVDQ